MVSAAINNNTLQYECVWQIQKTRNSYDYADDFFLKYSNNNLKIESRLQKDIDIDLTNQIQFEQEELPPYYLKNKELLDKAFNKEVVNCDNVVNKKVDDVRTIFNQTSSLISELPFDKATVEITKSEYLKFTFLFSEDKLLLISKPLSPVGDLGENEIIFSYFINRELILSNAAQTSSFVKGFKEYLPL